MIINNNVARAFEGGKCFRRSCRAQHGGNQKLQREHVAADPSNLSRPGTHRTVFDELMGRQKLVAAIERIGKKMILSADLGCQMEESNGRR